MEHPEAITANTTVFPVYVLDRDETPLTGGKAVITANGTDILATATVDDNGFADLIFSDPPEGNNLKLTITRPDVIPYIAELDFEDAAGFTLTESDFSEAEGYEGNNGDGTINPGEQIAVDVQFEYTGLDELTDLTVVLSLPQGEGTVSDSAQAFETVEEGDAITINVPSVTLDTDLADGASVELLFTFEAEEFNQVHALWLDAVTAPRIQVAGYEFSGDWEPGDTADLSITLVNDHPDLDTGPVSGTLSTVVDFVTIDEPEGSWENIIAGGDEVEQDVLFTLTVDDEIYPGREVPVSLHLVTEDGYTSDLNLTLVVEGVTENVPTGPAGPGYYIYEDNDVGFILTPDYEYESINEIGENIGLTDNGNNQDRTVTIDLPFEFPYWEDVYDQVSVCSNGWFAFGELEHEFFRNRPIPAALSPEAGVCVFWDDLISGQVYMYHDDENGWFTIEWYNWSRPQGRNPMRFQARLFDPAVHGAPGGLGMIALLYDDVDNNDAAENYCTIGIISPDGVEGLEYEFARNNPPTAAGIQDGRQLMIAVGLDGGVTPADLEVTPTVLNLQLEPDDLYETTINLHNIGGLRLSYEVQVEGIWHAWQEGEPDLALNGFPAPHPLTLTMEESATQLVNPTSDPGISMRGGPDNYGYIHYDSDESYGPIFDWLDIAEPENEVEFFGEGSGSVSGPLPLPFSFPFYGESYDTLWVCESGYIVFIDPEGEGISPTAGCLIGSAGCGSIRFLEQYRGG